MARWHVETPWLKSNGYDWGTRKFDWACPYALDKMFDFPDTTKRIKIHYQSHPNQHTQEVMIEYTPPNKEWGYPADINYNGGNGLMDGLIEFGIRKLKQLKLVDPKKASKVTVYVWMEYDA